MFCAIPCSFRFRRMIRMWSGHFIELTTSECMCKNWKSNEKNATCVCVSTCFIERISFRVICDILCFRSTHLTCRRSTNEEEEEEEHNSTNMKERERERERENLHGINVEHTCETRRSIKQNKPDRQEADCTEKNCDDVRLASTCCERNITGETFLRTSCLFDITQTRRTLVGGTFRLSQADLRSYWASILTDRRISQTRSIAVSVVAQRLLAFQEGRLKCT